MDENELRTALRATVMSHPEPPPMRSHTAVAAARRSMHRRNLLAGAGAAVAILAVTVAVIPARGYFGGGTGIQPAAAPQPSPSALPDDSPTKPSWPAEAGGDATADSGQHYDTGKALLDDVLDLVPDGYTAPDGRNGEYDYRSHQASIQDGGYWAYLVSIALRKDDGYGGLTVEVHEPGNTLPGDVCGVATAFWSRGGTCTPRTVDGRKVGVVRENAGTEWAAYRHTDGTVVYVMQSTETGWGSEAGLGPLPTLPLTGAELAAVAVDDRLR